jgi:hypothetical protein
VKSTDVGALDGLLGSLESETDVLVPSLTLGLADCLGVLEDVGLFEEGSLGLYRQFSHGGGWWLVCGAVVW